MVNLNINEGISLDSINGSFYSPGDIIMLNSTSIPTGFLLCNGSTITQADYPALFNVLGTYYDTAGLVCKLPNLNQATWTFPCSTVGNEAAYPVTASSHSHTSTTSSAPADPTANIAHTHSIVNTSTNVTSVHNHSGTSGAVGANVASTLANRSNASDLGVNLAIYGHTHSWGYSTAVSDANSFHSHTSTIDLASSATNHIHNATITTTSSTASEYIPNNVISMRYYIKW